MNRKLCLLFVLLLPLAAYAQSIKMPLVGSKDNSLTKIINIEVTAKNTIVTFKSLMPAKGSWIQLSKGIYLQDANGEDMYNYVASEGITVAPVKTYAKADNEEKIFKVYFKKLKPGTKAINVIERAVPTNQQQATGEYFNYYNVSLTVSAPANGYHTKVTDVVLLPPPPINSGDRSASDTSNVNPFSMADVAPMMNSMYTNMLDAQLKVYSNPETTAKIARITKNYYDALIKVGFSEDAALRILTSKPLISMDGIK